MNKPSKILVVEDRYDWQDIVCSTISEEGNMPFSAMSLDQAVNALGSEQFDLAIIDPVLDTTNRFNRDGLSVIQRVRESQPSIPVVIVTGSLTQDLKTSLQRLCPEAPVLFKSNWDADEFNHTVNRLACNGKEDSIKSAILESRIEGITSLTPPPSELALTRPRVLIVENHEDWQNIVANVLDEANYFWRIATTAEEALKEMDKENFHLIILDLKLKQNNLPLPSNEGWLLLDFLAESHSTTQVIVLSGQASPSDVVEILTRYPVIGFIEKQNFNSESIKSAIAKAAKTPNLHIQTLGHFRVWRDDEVIDKWENPQAEILLKILLSNAVRENCFVSSEELAKYFGEDTWHDLIDEASRTLEPNIRPCDSRFIIKHNNGYYFDMSSTMSWDLTDFQNHLEKGVMLVENKQWQEAVVELEKGRALYKNDFLEGIRYVKWMAANHRKTAIQYIDLMINLADAYAATKAYPKAVEACLRALDKNPLLEPLYRRIMRFHYCSGQKDAALKIYRDFIKLFEELLGQKPEPKTVTLQQAILNDEELGAGS